MTSNHRRAFLLAAPAVIVCGKALPQEAKEFFSDGSHIDDYFLSDEVGAAVGPANPKSDEITKAFAIMFPIIWSGASSTPYQIAKKLNSITDVNGDGHSYKKEWPTRANPLIVNMFAMTNTRPSGDVTPWCAAFVNFCLVSSGRKSTNSAASASFRNSSFYPQVALPKEGDLVVFTNRQNQAQGHVGFYVSGQDPIRVLGGNQSDGIVELPMAQNGGTLKLHSFRKVA